MSMRSFVKYIDSIMPGFGIFDIADKEKNTALHVQMFLDRLQSMFKYENLPDSIPEKYLELYLMCNGSCIIAQDPANHNLYALVGSLADVPDAYYLPTKYTVANPYLKLSEEYIIEQGAKEQNAVLIRNDTFMVGLLPLLKKYGSLMAENELSMNIAVINSRIISLITADTDAGFESAKKYLDDIKDGKLGAIASSAFFEGIKTQPFATSSQGISLTSMIEYEQYLKASLYNEIGLNANYNMKRESINSNESQLNDDMLTPLIDDMMRCRQEAIENINNLFGTDIKVDFASAWKDNEITTGLEMEVMKSEADAITDGSLDDPVDADPAEGEPEEKTEEVQPDEMEKNPSTEESTDADQGDASEDLSEIEEIKEDIEDIKEDIEEIKEEVIDDVFEA